MTTHKQTPEQATNQVPFEVNLGKRVREVREARGFRQVDFANRVGLSQSAISQIEQGRKTPSLGTLRKVASALDIDLALLFANEKVHVFNLEKLRAEISSAEHLSASTYKSLGMIVQYARDIHFIRSKLGGGG